MPQGLVEIAVRDPIDPDVSLVLVMTNVRDRTATLKIGYMRNY